MLSILRYLFDAAITIIIEIKREVDRQQKIMADWIWRVMMVTGIADSRRGSPAWQDAKSAVGRH